MLALSWLTGKQSLSPKEELFLDLFEECCHKPLTPATSDLFLLQNAQETPSSWNSTNNDKQWQSSWHDLSSSVKTRLEKLSKDELRNDIVNRTKNGCSPFFVACELGHYNIVKYLLNISEPDIEQLGRYEALEDHRIHSVSPIWVAAVSGHVKVVELLLKHNANVNSRSDTGSTPLRSVCFQCKYDYGDHNNIDVATTNQVLNEPTIGGQLPQYNRRNLEENHMQIVKLLVDNGADLTIANYNGGSCLINSIHSYELTKFILDNGAKINASDHEGKTALHYAILKGSFRVVKLLLSRGANPMLKANSRDDALQLSCIGGHVSIFEHLVRSFQYPKSRLVEAYKLLGSSILELHYDLTKVRDLWSRALELRQEIIIEQRNRIQNVTPVKSVQDRIDELEENEIHKSNYENNWNSSLIPCDIRRSLAFGDIREITTQSDLLSLSADEFRIQSLIISERILGQSNRETIQRLLSRGTNYIKSLRPDRCIDLWIYALQLELKHESIFNSESILAVQTITNLFFELLSQRIEVRFQDIYDVLSLLVDQLEDGQRHLGQRPVSYLHNYIFDRLLEIIKNLLLVLDCTTDEFCASEEITTPGWQEQLDRKIKMIDRLVQIDPRTSNGSSMLHICIVPSSIDKNDVQKLVNSFAEKDLIVHLVKLIELFVERGMDIDIANHDGLSALQLLCSTYVSGIMDKKSLIIRRLVDLGAHLDRRPSDSEQDKVIKQNLREAGVDPISHLRLSCLAAKQLAAAGVNYDVNLLTRDLRDLIAIH